MQRYIVRIGGSLIYNDALTLNDEFLRKLSSLINSALKEEKQFVFITGGGKLTRYLIDEASTINSPEDVGDMRKHYLGLEITHVNKAIIGLVVNNKKLVPVQDFAELQMMLQSGLSVVMGGSHAGATTDMTASEIAVLLGINDIYKLSVIDGVYNKDPNKFTDAKKIASMTWDGYLKLFGMSLSGNLTDTPGLHAPVDFVCSKFAYEHQLRFHISGGIENWTDYAGTLLDILNSGSTIT
jgi:uridylate kinase